MNLTNPIPTYFLFHFHAVLILFLSLPHFTLISNMGVPEKSCSRNCVDCLEDCYNAPPPPPVDHSNHNISTYLIISFSIVAAVFLLLCCYAIYVKFFSNRNRSSRRALLTEDGFVDEEQHGPVLDHPIWYIRTPGLQQSIISAITVCKYKKGEGLIEGTDCSVCLSEFQEDESLRLLPKCNHAFHLPCIDTWLRSHTNCPMCRAPIVVLTDPSRIQSMEQPQPNVFGSSSVESARMEVLENSGETGEDSVVAQLRNGEDEDDGEEAEEDGRRVCEGESSPLEVVNMQPRRSVSLDSSSAAKINLALSTVLSVEESHHGNSNRQQVGEVNEQIVSKRVAGNGNFEILHIASNSMKRSRSFNGKHLLSWHSRSQKKSNGHVRSF